MTSNKLISFSNKLSNEFVNHIQTTNNICIYKLGSHCIPNNIIFSNATHLTLINCSKIGILNIFTPNIFPNLTDVNYLSSNPGNFKIYENFNDKIKWTFPNKIHDFYELMVKSGRGKKDSELLKQYVTNKKIIDGKNGFDISFEFDINIPEYGIVSGQWWQSQFYEYLVSQQNTQQSESNQEIEEQILQKNKVMDTVDNIDFD